MNFKFKVKKNVKPLDDFASGTKISRIERENHRNVKPRGLHHSESGWETGRRQPMRRDY